MGAVLRPFPEWDVSVQQVFVCRFGSVAHQGSLASLASRKLPIVAFRSAKVPSFTGLRFRARPRRRNRGVPFASAPWRDGARSTHATTELSRSERRLWPLKRLCQSPQRRIRRWPDVKETSAQRRQVPRRNEIPAYVWQHAIHTNHMPIQERVAACGRVRGDEDSPARVAVQGRPQRNAVPNVPRTPCGDHVRRIKDVPMVSFGISAADIVPFRSAKGSPQSFNPCRRGSRSRTSP
jgi:hypothetical protein